MKPCCSNPLVISVGARYSPLSQAQVREVLEEIRLFYPAVQFLTHFRETIGDKDKKTSLRLLEKTDFFTREIDEMLLVGGCRIAIHSAKDLPDPLPSGLKLAALTRGADPSDSLVLGRYESLDQLPADAVIATSSQRREDQVRTLRSDLRFIDLRGTIEERLELLGRGGCDGLVIAEAALIRLNLVHLSRVALPGPAAPLQGKLAVVIRQDDEEMVLFFKAIDIRDAQKTDSIFRFRSSGGL